MTELKPNDLVSLTNGSKAKVIKELGRGGQGIVYLVELAGQKMALKWYINPPRKEFYKNLQENITDGAPSEAFLWPEYLTERQKGTYGYVMKLRPQGYYEFGQYLLAKVQFKSFEAITNAAMMICEGFKDLHLKGLSYQDLNDGNFFINPETGDVLICDNDNVFPQGGISGIMGKARYMAPEVVCGKATPDKFTDRFSLAVVLFLLFFGNHPLEGSRVLACPCMTEKFEKKFYGEEPIFIFDPKKTENRPVRGVHNNVLRKWPIYPESLRNAFIKDFSEEALKNQQLRTIEADWQRIIQKLRDSLLRCPHCGDETFAEAATADCMCCGKPLNVAGTLRFANNRDILLTVGSRVYVDLDNNPDIEVVSVPGDKYPVQLRNLTANKWTVETPSGKLRAIDPKGMFPVKAGLKVSIIATNKTTHQSELI